MMKKYKVRINNKVFDVVLEEVEELTTNVKPEKKVSLEPKPATVTTDAIDILAPIQGSVINVLVKANDHVKKGDVLLLIEAMKLENEVNAPKDCEIIEVLVNKGDNVNTNQILIKIK